MPEYRYSLRAIVDDLWGTSTAPKPNAESQPHAEPAYVPTFPPFDQLWKTADDTVDWTDALAHSKPTDNLVSPALWSFFHQHADAVLHGETQAYVQVLEAAHPLSDIAPYGKAFDVEVTSSDRLSLLFEPHPDYLAKEESEVRRYLCSVALRAARDLFAILPIREVAVSAQQEGTALLQVTFQRSELQKVRFSFIDPVAFVTECGAVFA